MFYNSKYEYDHCLRDHALLRIIKSLDIIMFHKMHILIENVQLTAVSVLRLSMEYIL